MVENELILRYLSMINLEESDANSIMRDIKIFLNAKDISFQSLYHIRSDETSVITSKYCDFTCFYLINLFIYLLLFCFLFFRKK